MATPLNPTPSTALLSPPVEEVTVRSRPRLSLGSRVGYGVGELACVLVFYGMSSFLSLFYTDAVGISATVAGLIILAARIADAVFDTVVGALAERTRSKRGRFRSWIFFGALPVGVFAVLTFTAPFPGDTAGAVVWAIITYGLCGFVFSCVNLPYAALSASMGETQADRMSMNSMRFVFSSIGLVVTGLITLPLVAAFGASSGKPFSVVGFTLTSIVFALVGVALFFVTYATSREKIAPVREERPTAKETLRAVFTNWPLFVVALLSIFGAVAYFGRLGVLAYYYIYNSDAPALVSILFPLGPIAGLVGALLFSRFAPRVGKRNLFIIGSLVQAAALLLLFVSDATSIPIVIALTVLHGLAGFTIPLTYAMVADSVDHGEYRTGVRADGVSFAVISVAQKIAFASGGIALALLGIFGYQAGTAQTPETLQGINIVVNLLPAAISIAAALIALFYRLTEKQAVQIRNDLSTGAIATQRTPKRR